MDNTQSKQLLRQPIAILTSDVHFSLQTLGIASKAFAMAVHKANELDIPLIVAGDLHDSKANMRGECVNEIISLYKKLTVASHTIVGNHSRLNERAPAHALHFLESYTCLVDEPMYMPIPGAHCIPYHHDPDELKAYLKTIPKGSTLIMHQGIEGSNAGDYIQDKSAIRPEDVAGMRVISGHYHTRQTIKLPDGGAWDYCGNPYTLNYAEANDPPKGFQILMDDGSLEFVPTNLRKHIVINMTAENGVMFNDLQDESPGVEDLVWVKVTGVKETLVKITRDKIAKCLNIPGGFRLDLIPLDTTRSAPAKQTSQSELLDSLIDSTTNTSDEKKTRLKELWKGMI